MFKVFGDVDTDDKDPESWQVQKGPQWLHLDPNSLLSPDKNYTTINPSWLGEITDSLAPRPKLPLTVTKPDVQRLFRMPAEHLPSDI